jgi:hypothetical protein
MSFLVPILDQLGNADAYGYHRASLGAAEPTALSALALLAHDRVADAQAPLDWLLDQQTPAGNVDVIVDQPTPGWATGWAICAWHAAQHGALPGGAYSVAAERATAWLLGIEGSQIEYLDHSGHDTTIVGWPWVEGTHSWIEPTAIGLLALKHAGKACHPRAREATRLLLDRLLVTGGCNYGNTVVFGQRLRPHIQPTGLALLALAGEPTARRRLDKSFAFLADELSAATATESLCYGLLGLAAHDRCPSDAKDWLAAAAQRTLTRDAAPYKLALLALAAQGSSCPLIPSVATAEAKS